MVEFIAEICSNHNGSIYRALTLIDEAATAGCAAVKFQLFRLDKLYTPEILTRPDYQFLQERRGWELPLDWLPLLTKRCHERGIKFACTPFYLEAVDQLRPYVDFYKIASYSLIHLDLLAKVAQTGKPVVLSTGMATVGEIYEAITCLKDNGCKNLTLLYCVSSYPCHPQAINPVKLDRLRDMLLAYTDRSMTVQAGWSDHSVSAGIVSAMTLRYRAQVVEFHFDLDGQGREYGIGHCWKPEQIEPVIKAVKEGERVIPNVWAMDNLSQDEENERLWRADPSDGLRPVKILRSNLNN